MLKPREQFTDIHGQILHTVQASEANPDARLALKAAVKEFHRSAHRAMSEADAVDEGTTRTSIAELEQAGHSAKVAATASDGISGPARKAIVAAHDAISALKAETLKGA